MARKIPYEFGTAGDLTSVPDESTSTELSFESGWSPAYELKPTDAGYRELDRGQHNWLWNTTTGNIKEWQEQLYPEHQPDTIYPIGMITIYGGTAYIRKSGTTATPDPSVSAEWLVYDAAPTPETTPINNQWNGTFTIDHLTPLPSPDGLPATSTAGGTVYGADAEFTHGVYSSAASNTISLDDDGLIFSGGIYREYGYTAEQLSLIDTASVPVYIVAQDGSKYYVKHNATSVVVTKPTTTTLRVQINNSLFTELSISKVFTFHATNSTGFVPQISPSETRKTLQSAGVETRKWTDVSGSRSTDVPFPNELDYPIEVSVLYTGFSGAPSRVRMEVDGVTVDGGYGDPTGSAQSLASAVHTVYPNESYTITFTTGTLLSWQEKF